MNHSIAPLEPVKAPLEDSDRREDELENLIAQFIRREIDSRSLSAKIHKLNSRMDLRRAGHKLAAD